MESEASIADPGLATIVEGQMRAADLSWLSFEPYRDVAVGHLKIAVWTATICEPNGAVSDVWIVSGGPCGFSHPYAGRYNRENYPEMQDAVSQHVGRLVQEGYVKLVDPDDAPKRKRKRYRTAD